MPGLDQAQFYGAAYYLSLKQRQQKGTQAARETYLSSDTNELAHDGAAVINLFLDRLALLFARFKHKSLTPANVTATGLVVDGDCWVFYVSKNGGPWEGDETFAETLQAWINSELADEPEEHSGEDGIWKAVEEFWEERVTHYAKKILDDHIYLPIHGTSPSGQSTEKQTLMYAKVREIFEKPEHKVNMEILKRDWEQVVELSTNLEQWAQDSNKTVKKKKKQNTKRKITLPFEAFQACYAFWRRDSRQDYPRIDKVTNRFYKRIHNIEMLGMLLSAWKACIRMRSARGGARIKIEFIEKLPDFKLMKSELVNTIDRWQGSRKFALDKPLDRLREAEAEVAAAAAATASGSNGGSTREPSSFTQFFHCELQMLQLFHQLKDKEPHWYIGCSKLSCHFCSRIIENGKKHGQRYQTRGGHYKISQNCAFPFSLSDELGYISEALSTVQYEMLHSIHQYAAAIKDEFTTYSIKDDTVQGRTGDASDTISFRSSATQKGKLLNWTRLQNPRPSVRTRVNSYSVKALKLGSKREESFEIVQIVKGYGRRSDLIAVQTDTERGPGILELAEPGVWEIAEFNQDIGSRSRIFCLFYRQNQKHPVNEWVLGRSHSVAQSWNVASKHCLFRGDMYLLGLRSYLIATSDESEEHDGAYQRHFVYEDVDAMDEIDETFVNYRDSVSGDYASGVSLWRWIWYKLEQQLSEYFKQELLDTIRFEENKRNRDTERELMHLKLQIVDSANDVSTRGRLPPSLLDLAWR